MPEIAMLASLLAAVPAALQVACVTVGVPAVGVVQVAEHILGFNVAVTSIKQSAAPLKILNLYVVAAAGFAKAVGTLFPVFMVSQTTMLYQILASLVVGVVAAAWPAAGPADRPATTTRPAPATPALADADRLRPPAGRRRSETGARRGLLRAGPAAG